MAETKTEMTVLTQEQISQCEKCEKRIIAETGKMEKGFLKIAPDVARVKALGWYTANGYKTMDKYAKDVLHMGKATMYNLLGIVARFGDPETFEIRDKYDGLSMRQLVQLMALPENMEGELPDGWRTLSSDNLRKEIKSLKAIEGDTEGDGEEAHVKRHRNIFTSEREFTKNDIAQFNGDALSRLVKEAEELMISGGESVGENTVMVLRVVLTNQKSK